jgi:hypothetical protein
VILPSGTWMKVFEPKSNEFGGELCDLEFWKK